MSRNSAAKLAWDRQGELAEGDIQQLVQGNAMCDWLQYAAEQSTLSPHDPRHLG